jgi:Holliday junction resolvase
MSARVGIARELKLVRLVRSQGWIAWTVKNDGECRDDDEQIVAHGHGKYGQGPVDVIAIPPGGRVRLVQVKSTKAGPYERFGPRSRASLKEEARRAGADAWLAYWPPKRREPLWICATTWPTRGAA